LRLVRRLPRDVQWIEVQQPRRVGAQQLFLERAPESKVEDCLDRCLPAIRDVREVAAEDDAILKLQYALDRRRSTQELVEYHRRVEVDALIKSTEVEELVELVGACMRNDHLQTWVATHQPTEHPRPDVLGRLGASTGVDQQ